MFCRHCGNQMADGVRFCNKCGSPVVQTEPAEPTVAEAPVAADLSVAEESAPMTEATVEVEAPAVTTVVPPTYAPPAYTPPVYAAPSAPEHPKVRCLKQHHTSGLFIAAIVAYSAMVLCQLLQISSASASLNALSNVLPSGVASGLASSVSAFAIIGMIPVFLVVAGLWIFYANSRKPDNRSTTGLTLIKTSIILRLIGRIAALVLCLILCLAMIGMVGASKEMLAGEMDDFGSSLDGFGSFSDDFGSSVDDFGASAAPMASFSYSGDDYQVFVEDYDQFADEFDEYLDDPSMDFGESMDEFGSAMDTAMDVGFGVLSVLIVVLVIAVVIGIGVPIAHDFCILSSLKSLRETLQTGAYAPRALGAVQVFNWIFAVSGFFSLISSLSTGAVMGSLLERLGALTGESMPIDPSMFAPDAWALAASALMVAAYVLFALSISQYKKAQKAA